MEWKPVLIIGSKQANAFVGSVEEYALVLQLLVEWVVDIYQ